MFQLCGTLSYITLETLLPPVMDQEYNFGVLQNGAVWSGAAAVGVLSYVALQFMTRRGVRDINLFICGQVLFATGTFFLAPWPWQLRFETAVDAIDDLPHWRFGVGLFLVVLGFTQSDAVSMSLFSKAIEDNAAQQQHAHAHAHSNGVRPHPHDPMNLPADPSLLFDDEDRLLAVHAHGGNVNVNANGVRAQRSSSHDERSSVAESVTAGGHGASMSVVLSTQVLQRCLVAER